MCPTHGKNVLIGWKILHVEKVMHKFKEISILKKEKRNIIYIFYMFNGYMK
jgi:hypothetical protein